MSEFIVEIRKNARKVLRLLLDEFNGRQVFNARVWFEADDGEMRPGKSGLTFRVDLLPDYVGAVTATLEAARRRGLVE